MVFDIARVRGLYTSLSDGWTYLNADSCPQVPEMVNSAVSRSFRSARIVDTSNIAAKGAHAQDNGVRLHQTQFVWTAKRALADLVGAHPDAIILGPDLPTLYAQLSRAVRPLLRRGAEVIQTRIDTHQLNVQAPVHFAEPDLGTGEVPAWQYANLVQGVTRLVTLAAAHPLVGTMNPVAEIADIVHTRSRAWVVVDASAVAGLRPLSIDELGADILAVDCAAFGGPEVAALIFRDTTMFPRIDTQCLESRVSPGLAGGVSAAVDHLADLVEQSRGRRSKRLEHSLEQTQEYLHGLQQYLIDSLGALPQVHLFGVTGEVAENARVDRIPRMSFCIQGVPAITIHERLIQHRLLATLPESDLLLQAMGAEETQGALSIGLSPFTTTHDIDQLLRALASIA